MGEVAIVSTLSLSLPNNCKAKDGLIVPQFQDFSHQACLYEDLLALMYSDSMVCPLNMISRLQPFEQRISKPLRSFSSFTSQSSPTPCIDEVGVSKMYQQMCS